MSGSALHDIPGGEALFDWFGRVPRFHDANLLEIIFSGKGSGLLRIHTWIMTNKVDAKGYFVLDKHVVVTLALEAVSAINCTNFDIVPAVIFDLEITRLEQGFRLEWSASYGVSGSMSAKQVRITLEPGEPSQS
jgi:hypothetical protein